KIDGRFSANPSKGAMQRSVAEALLAKGSSIIYNPGMSNDSIAALNVSERMAAKIHYYPDKIEIASNGIQPVTATINCGESGLGIRMFTPIAALSEKLIRIEGIGSLKSRPVDFFENVLPQLGVQCKT